MTLQTYVLVALMVLVAASVLLLLARAITHLDRGRHDDRPAASPRPSATTEPPAPERSAPVQPVAVQPVQPIPVQPIQPAVHQSAASQVNPATSRPMATPAAPTMVARANPTVAPVAPSTISAPPRTVGSAAGHVEQPDDRLPDAILAGMAPAVVAAPSHGRRFGALRRLGREHEPTIEEEVGFVDQDVLEHRIGVAPMPPGVEPRTATRPARLVVSGSVAPTTTLGRAARELAPLPPARG
ncbi:MAG TPA: hypothetical protein VK592_05135, partial [Candidatus Dormibacteraeota bacterium]|nr:hypothetical protein [Candidatus Dormibacteraeota bacterium]